MPVLKYKIVAALLLILISQVLELCQAGRDDVDHPEAGALDYLDERLIAVLWQYIRAEAAPQKVNMVDVLALKENFVIRLSRVSLQQRADPGYEFLLLSS